VGFAIGVMVALAHQRMEASNGDRPLEFEVIFSVLQPPAYAIMSS